MSIETIRENLPAVLRLAAEILREPSFPAKEFEELQQENLAGIEQQQSEPNALAPERLPAPHEPLPEGRRALRRRPSTNRSRATRAATLDDAKKFYGGFYGASNGELAVVGDFDDAAGGEARGRALRRLEEPGALRRASPQPYQDVAGRSTRSLETPDKANAFFIAGQNLPMRDDDPGLSRARARQLHARRRLPELAPRGPHPPEGRPLLRRRLPVRRRRRSTSPGSFTTFAIYAPQNEAKLEAAFQEEIARVLKDGFEAKEIAEAKSGWLQSRQVGRAQDPALARTLATDLYLKRTLAWDAELREEGRGADGASRSRPPCASTSIPSKMTIVKAGDFAKRASAPATPARELTP